MDHTQPATASTTQWLAAFDNALAFFADECHWRDLLAFTWNIVTTES